MTESRSLRVGDAERDAAVSALGEHFAAGRITKEEFDDRSAQAWTARFGADLDLLFTDLPRPVAVRSSSEPTQGVGPPRGMPRPRAWMLLMVPFAFMAVGGLLFLIVSVAPWLLFVLFMMFLFGGPRRHHHWHQRRYDGPRPGWGPPRSGWGHTQAEWRHPRRTGRAV